MRCKICDWADDQGVKSPLGSSIPHQKGNHILNRLGVCLECFDAMEAGTLATTPKDRLKHPSEAILGPTEGDTYQVDPDFDT